MRTNKQKAETLRRALSPQGCIAFAAIDQPLVSELCELIKALHNNQSITDTQLDAELSALLAHEREGA